VRAESERVANPLRAHHGQARCVHETEIVIPISLEQGKGAPFDIFLDKHAFTRAVVSREPRNLFAASYPRVTRRSVYVSPTTWFVVNRTVGSRRSPRRVSAALPWCSSSAIWVANHAPEAAILLFG